MVKPIILTVDDNAINLKLLTRTLKKSGYNVLNAQNGNDACQLAIENKPDLILLDVMMPGMDGFKVCQILKNAPNTKDIPVIFLSAKNEAVDKVHGLALGAVDYITKPFDSVEVIARVDTHLRLRKLHQQVLEKNKQLEAAYSVLRQKNEKIDKDIKAAGMVQRQLLPQSISHIGPLKFAWKFVPSSHVAGDIFNILQLDKSHVALFIVDVSGHGVQSAMLAVSIHNFFRAGIDAIKIEEKLKKSHPLYYLLEPQKVTKALNDNFSMDTFDAYFTCIYIVINTETLEAKMVNAGHPYPLIIHSNNSINFLEHGDIPIGMMENAEFSVKDFELKKNDKLILYTDGIYEVTVGEKIELDKTDFVEILISKNGSLEHRFEHTVQQVLKISDKDEFTDDVSLFGVEII